MLQVNGNTRKAAGVPHKPSRGRTLSDLRRGDEAILDSLDLPDDESRRLMEMGFLPGARVVAARSAPGGDPRVFQVDGAEVALRRETASRLHIVASPSHR